MPSPALPNFGPFPDPSLSLADLRTSAPHGGSEDLWLDTKQARGAVEEMRKIAEDLARINVKLMPINAIPTAKDLISRNFVNNCALVVDDARDYFSAWQVQLTNAIDALDAQVKSHELTEEQNQQNIARSW